MRAVVAGAGAVCTALLAWRARRAGTRARVAGLRSSGRRGVAPRCWARWLGPRLEEAGVGLDASSALGAWLGASALAVVVGSGASPVVGLLGGAALLLAGPVGLALARSGAERRRAAELPAALERVASELRSGCTVVEAVDSLGRAPGPLQPDFGTIGRATGRGAGLSDALAAWARRSPVEGAPEAAGGLAVAARMGGAAAPALDGLAASLRDRLAAGAEARAQSSQARLSAWVVGGAPLAYLAFASVADPGSVSVLLGTGAGRVCLLGGLALEGAGAAWMRRIVAMGPR